MLCGEDSPPAVREFANLLLTILLCDWDPTPIPPAAHLLLMAERAFEALVGIPCPASKPPTRMCFKDDLP
jgi:hypothetical protein